MTASPAEAEREVARTRAELALTLEALGRKLAARQLVEKGFDMVSDYDALGQRGLDIIRANPIPVALIGIGAAWLIAANTVPPEQIAAARKKITGMAGDLGNRAGDLASGIAEKAGLGGTGERPLGYTGNPVLDQPGDRHTDGWLHQMTDTAQGALRSVRQSGGAMLGDGAGRVSGRLSDAFARNPLVVGAIGAMAGALLAALLPVTDAENRLFGDERLQRKAGEAGEEAVARVREAAAGTLEAAAAVVKGEPDKSPQF